MLFPTEKSLYIIVCPRQTAAYISHIKITALHRKDNAFENQP